MNKKMKKDLTVHIVTAFIPFLFPGCGKNVHFFTQAEMFFIVGAALLLDLPRPSSVRLTIWCSDQVVGPMK